MRLPELNNKISVCFPGKFAFLSWGSQVFGIQSNMLSEYQAPSTEGTMFPDGLKVLAVDSDVNCLRSLVVLLEQCNYKVTAATKGSEALQMLRDSPQDFDIVILDAEIQDMDGFTLLHSVVDQADVPVIMTSAKEDTSMVQKGIEHGACCFLLKPLRPLEMKYIWQHVVRKRLEKNAVEMERSKEIKQEDHPQESSLEDGHAQRKQRVSWTDELHVKFVDAIQILGSVEKAVPSKILELMDEPGLSRECVASHLQKHRNMLKKDEPRAIRERDNLGPRKRGRPSKKATTLSQGCNSLAPNNDTPISSFQHPTPLMLQHVANQSSLFQQCLQQPPQMAAGLQASVPSAPMWVGSHFQSGFPAQQVLPVEFPSQHCRMERIMNPSFFIKQDERISFENFNGFQNALAGPPLDMQIPDMESNNQMFWHDSHSFQQL